MNLPSRVAFTEGQRLTADDLTAEQEYRLALVGRHILAAHEWGVVIPEQYAVDGYGRELIGWDPATADPAWAFACEQPSEARCEPGSRIVQTTVAITAPLSTETLESPAERIERILSGRASGTFNESVPPWPVLVSLTKKQVHFTSLNAATVRDVYGQVALRLRDNTSNPFAFLVSTPAGPRWAAAPGRPEKSAPVAPCGSRIAFDNVPATQNNLYFWGDVTLDSALRRLFLLDKTGALWRFTETKLLAGNEWLAQHKKDGYVTPPSAPDPHWEAAPGQEEGSEYIKHAILRVKSLILTAAVPPPGVPSTRQIVCDASRNSLQIHCGALQESDFSTRLQIGAAVGGELPGLAVTGSGGTSIQGTLEVDGTLFLPPVRPSILDPLFNPLLVLMYIAGLRRANSFGAIYFNNSDLSTPKVVALGEKFAYTLTLKPKEATLDFNATRVLEQLTRPHKGGRVDTERDQFPNKANPSVKLFRVIDSNVAEPGESFAIAMQLAIAIKGVSTALTGLTVPESNPIKVLPRVQLEIEPDLPFDFVPLNTVSEYSVITETRPEMATAKLTLRESGTEILTSVDTIPTQTIAAAADSKELAIEVTMNYRWAANTDPSEDLTVKKTIYIGGILVEVTPPLTPGTNRKYRVALTNKSGAPISNIHNGKVTLMRGSTELDQFLFQGFDLARDETKAVPNALRNISATLAAGDVLKLKVSYHFTRQGQALDQEHTQTITVS